MNFYFEYKTIKASKRYDLSNPITAAFKALETAVTLADHPITSYDDADVVVVFGSITHRKTETERAIVVQRARDSGKHILSLDSGLFGTYIREKTKSPESGFFRIMYGDCTGQGEMVPNTNNTRLNWFCDTYNIKIKEPKENDGPILIIGQSEKGWQYDSKVPYHSWVGQTIHTIREQTDRPIIYRVHPTDVGPSAVIASKYENVSISRGNRTRMGILDDLEKCTTSFTHSSSAAFESLVEGLYTFALDERCVVSEGCSNGFTPMPWDKRMDVLAKCANNTYHIKEMTNPSIIDMYVNYIESKK